jgi:hypothetical protein
MNFASSTVLENLGCEPKVLVGAPGPGTQILRAASGASATVLSGYILFILYRSYNMPVYGEMHFSSA